MLLGEKIRHKRKSLGFSLRGFAKKCPVSPSFLSDIELGKTPPSIGTLELIAANLGESVRDLLSDVNPPLSPSPEGEGKRKVKVRPVMRSKRKVA